MIIGCKLNKQPSFFYKSKVYAWVGEIMISTKFYNFVIEKDTNFPSTCSVEWTHQFGTNFVGFELCISEIEVKLSIFNYKIGHKGLQRSNLRWLPILRWPLWYIQTMYQVSCFYHKVHKESA